ncbi:MAG TPA: hypothetical protein VMJ30_07005 [Gemmatimonadales bacterium]|nr:hypothetical protein [Gemmatimonadales bacterium]
MNRKDPLIAAALMLALAGSVAAQQAANDPIGNGRPLSAWVADLKGEAPETRHDAAYEIAWMGPAAAPAVPALIEALNRPDEKPTVLYPIEVALREIGPAASAAIPSLEKMEDHFNDDVAHMAKQAIRAIRGEKLPFNAVQDTARGKEASNGKP